MTTETQDKQCASKSKWQQHSLGLRHVAQCLVPGKIDCKLPTTSWKLTFTSWCLKAFQSIRTCPWSWQKSCPWSRTCSIRFEIFACRNSWPAVVCKTECNWKIRTDSKKIRISTDLNENGFENRIQKWFENNYSFFQFQLKEMNIAMTWKSSACTKLLNTVGSWRHGRAEKWKRPLCFPKTWIQCRRRHIFSAKS